MSGIDPAHLAAQVRALHAYELDAAGAADFDDGPEMVEGFKTDAGLFGRPLKP